MRCVLARPAGPGIIKTQQESLPLNKHFRKAETDCPLHISHETRLRKEGVVDSGHRARGPQAELLEARVWDRDLDLVHKQNEAFILGPSTPSDETTENGLSPQTCRTDCLQESQMPLGLL